MPRRLRVENLSHTMDDEDLDRLFAPYGTIRSAEVAIDLGTGRSTGVGLVEFESDAEAAAAVAALHGVRCCGRVLAVASSTAGDDAAGVVT